MKGIIFNCLEEQVISDHGMAIWNEVLARASTDGIYVAGKSYRDAELFALIGVIEKMLKVERVTLVRSFGQALFEQLLAGHPHVTDDIRSFEQLLTGLETVIHTQVRKLYEQPNLPLFKHRYINDRTLILEYHSPRQLCMLAEGLLVGAADHFRQPLRLSHPLCTHEGAAHCELMVELLDE